jgi:hypothetical protein
MVSGDSAVSMEKEVDDAIIASAMEMIRVRYPQAPDPVAYVITRWASQPYVPRLPFQAL